MAMYVDIVIILVFSCTLSQSKPMQDDNPIVSRYSADESPDTDINSISSSDDDYFINAMDNFAKHSSKYPDPGTEGYESWGTFYGVPEHSSVDKRGYRYDLGKRSYTDDAHDDDIMDFIEALSPNNDDKRDYRTDLGKRAENDVSLLYDVLAQSDDVDKRAFYRTDLGKRAYRTDLGKRQGYRMDLGKRAYRVDLGKRQGYRTDLGKRAYRMDLGKRQGYRMDLGKRQGYRMDLGKRQGYRMDLGKRQGYRMDLGKRQGYRMDLGKRYQTNGQASSDEK